MTEVTVRRLAPEEWPQLREMRLRALTLAPEAFGSTLEQELTFSDEVWQSRVAPDGNPNFGAFADQRLVGLAVGVLDDADQDTVWVMAMWLDPDHRGRGIAEQLITQVMDWGRDQGRVTVNLQVAPDNPRALGLYRRLGFTETPPTQPVAREGAFQLTRSLA